MTTIAIATPLSSHVSLLSRNSNNDEPVTLARDAQLPRRRLGLRLEGRRSSKRRLCEISTSATSTSSKPKKSVHFAQDGEQLSVTLHHFDPLFTDQDRPSLWYSREDFVALEAQSKQVCEQHLLEPSKEATALQELYSQCLKTAAKRGSGIRRGLSGEKIARAVLEHDGTQQELASEPSPINDLRGLETGILPDLSQRRRQAIRQILTTQDNMANAHHAMRERSISKTAEHLSRVTVELAHKLALLDAQQAYRA